MDFEQTAKEVLIQANFLARDEFIQYLSLKLKLVYEKGGRDTAKKLLDFAIEKGLTKGDK